MVSAMECSSLKPIHPLNTVYFVEKQTKTLQFYMNKPGGVPQFLFVSFSPLLFYYNFYHTAFGQNKNLSSSSSNSSSSKNSKVQHTFVYVYISNSSK